MAQTNPNHLTVITNNTQGIAIMNDKNDNEMVSKPSTSPISTKTYENVIVRAIEQLRDSQVTGSSIGAIRKRVLADLPPNHVWNDSMFLRSLQHAIDHGHIEEQPKNSFRLSQQWIQRRIESRNNNKMKMMVSGFYDDSDNFWYKKKLLMEETKDVPKKKTVIAKKKLPTKEVVRVMWDDNRKTQKMDLDS